MAIEYKEQRTNKPTMNDTNVEIHRLGLKRISESTTAENEQRTEALEDNLFTHVEGTQTDEQTADIRKGRPNYEVNRVNLPVSQLQAEIRQNKVSSKVRPAKIGATLDTAEVINGLIRSIENDSNASHVDNVATKEAFTGGLGAFQIVTEYTDDDSFEQAIKIKPIYSACTSVYWSPSSQDEFHRDSDWCAVVQMVSNDKFERLYGPEQAKVGIDGLFFGNFDQTETDSVRIADYWVKEPYTKTIILFSDGTTAEKDEDLEKVLDELAEQGKTVVKERKVKSNKIVHYKLSGDSILEGPHEFPGTSIPVVPVYGYQMWIDGRHYYRGMVRLAKDAQRIYNYVTSSKIEQTAVSLNMKTTVTKRMLQGNKASWEDTNPATPRIVNPDPSVAGGWPLPPSAPPVNNALIEQGIQATQDILATQGQSSPSLGFNPGEQSGRALNIQKSQANLGTFELQDNYARAVERRTEILLELIPEVYDTPRMVRILGEDGSVSSANLNEQITDRQTGEVINVVNDLGLGKYDVITDIGPSFKSKKLETAEQMAFVLQTTPDMAPMLMDLYLKALDSPIAEEAAERIRAQLIKSGQIEPNEEEAQKLQQEAQAKGPDPMQEAQMKMVLAEAELKTTEAEQARFDLDKGQQLARFEIDQADADIDKTEAETIEKMASAALKEKTNPNAKAEAKPTKSK